MPALNRYAESSDKQGVYIRANAGGSTPVTLQVTDLAEKLFTLLDYDPPDTVSSKLVWSMYDVGLLYTLNSLDSTEGTDDTTTILDQLEFNSSLTPDQETKIIMELETYGGPDVDKVEELIDRLDGQRDPVEADLSYSEGGDLSLLQQWAVDPEKFSQLADSIKGFRSYATASIQTFAKHPYLSAPPVWLQDDGSIKYQLGKEDQDNDIYIYDHRYKRDYDFKVVLDRADDRYELAYVSKNGHIIEYRNEAGTMGARINMSGLVDWAIPDKRILVEIPTSSEVYNPRAIMEYDGKEVVPVCVPDVVNMSKVRAVEVDRISSNDNPIADLENHHLVLDQGKPGERFVVEELGGQRARVLSRFPSEMQG